MRSGFRKVIRTLLLLLVVATLFLFVYPLKDGKPLLSVDKIRLPAMPDVSLPDVALPTSGTGDTAEVTIYKWQDSEGGWHFSNEPPPAGVRYETSRINPDANRIGSVPGAASDTQKQTREGKTTGEEKPFDYSAEKISEMMGATSRVKNALESHNQKLGGQGDGE